MADKRNLIFYSVLCVFFQAASGVTEQQSLVVEAIKKGDLAYVKNVINPENVKDEIRCTRYPYYTPCDGWINYVQNYLYIAIENAKKDVVEYLLNSGADPNAMAFFESSAYETTFPGRYFSQLQAAIKTGSLEIVKILIENGAEINKPSRLERESYCYNTPSNDTICIYDSDRGGPATYLYPLTEALKNEQGDIAKYLVNKGALISDEDLELAKKFASKKREHSDIYAFLSFFYAKGQKR